MHETESLTPCRNYLAPRKYERIHNHELVAATSSLEVGFVGTIASGWSIATTTAAMETATSTLGCLDEALIDLKVCFCFCFCLRSRSRLALPPDSATECSSSSLAIALALAHFLGLYGG